MCDVLIPAIIGVAALGLLGGGNAVGSGCDNCPTGPVCAVTQVGNKTITVPQLAGEGTNVVQVSAQHDFSYQAQQPGPAPYHAGPAPYQPAPHIGQGGHFNGAPAYYDPYQSNLGASINYDGQSALGAGTYSSPDGGAGFGANVGGLGANIGVGPTSY